MREKEEFLQGGELIVQHNRLIEARYNLSLQEKRVIFWLISQINADDEEFKSYKLEVKEFAEMVVIDRSNIYRHLRLITKRLMQRVMEIFSADNDKIIQVAWLSSAVYETKKGYVSLEFSPHLKPYLLQLKSEFTKLNSADLLGLKSIYSVRIFELLMQYESIGSRKITIEDLRGYCGIQPKKYANYFDFKRKAIEHAKQEISAKTGYEIDYTEIKDSRKIVAIEFIIKKRTHFEKHQHEKTSIILKELRSQNILIEKIKEYGFSIPTAKKFLQQESEEVIENALKAVNLQIERGNVKNPKAMIRKAIQGHWKPDVFLSKKDKVKKQLEILNAA